MTNHSSQNKSNPPMRRNRGNVSNNCNVYGTSGIRQSSDTNGSSDSNEDSDTEGGTSFVGKDSELSNEWWSKDTKSFLK